MKFRMLCGGSRELSRITILDFRKAKNLLAGIPWVRALESRGVQESWLLLKHNFFHTYDWWMSMHKKSGKGGRRPI